MSIPINTRGLFDHLRTPQPAEPQNFRSPALAPRRSQNACQSSSTASPPPPPSTVPAPPLTPGKITRDPTNLRQWDTARPMLRFDFLTPGAQATFHRAFAQVRTEKGKADFMARFFDNYDGQVQIPRRLIMDTSRDEAMAREVQGALPPMLDTARDEAIAREVQRGLPPMLDTARDAEMVRRLQGNTPGERDELMARRMQRQSARDDARRRNAALNDEAIARRMQQEMQQEDQARGYGGQRYTGIVDRAADRVGDLSFGGREITYRDAGQRRQNLGQGRERRHPRGHDQAGQQGYGRGQPQGYGGGNGNNLGTGPGGSRGYGDPRSGQHYFDDEEDDDFDQSFGGGMGGYGPGYGNRR